MRKKLLPSMGLVIALGATTLAGCESDPGAEVAQRDVYSGPDAFQDCVADWGNADLCKDQLDAAAKQAAGAPAPGTAGSNVVFLWGPSYVPSIYGRSVNYGGHTYTPSSYRARNAASFAPSRGASSRSLMGFDSKTTPTSKTSSYLKSTRGGFGATGAKFSSGSRSFGG